MLGGLSPLAVAVRSSPIPAAGGDSLGPELVTNGGFADGTGWTLEGAGVVTISGGKLRYTDSVFDGARQEPNPFTEGLTYRAVYTIDSISEGGLQIVIGGEGFGTVRTTAGTFSEDIMAGFDEGIGPSLLPNGTETTAVVDNISVKEVL